MEPNKDSSFWCERWFIESPNWLNVVQYFLVPFHPIISIFFNQSDLYLKYINKAKGFSLSQNLRINRKIYFKIGTVVVVNLLFTFIFSFGGILLGTAKLFETEIWPLNVTTLLLVMLTMFFTASLNLVIYGLVLFYEYPGFMRNLFSKESKDQVCKWNEKLLGHKIWSGEKTYEMLDGLFKASRAKWFIINFLKEIVDDDIKNTDNKYEISSKRPWDTYRYSEFLATNMTHAEKDVWWLVEPSDFFSILLPDCMAYLFTCVALQQYSIDFQCLTKDYHKPPEIIKSDICSKLSGEVAKKFVLQFGNACKRMNVEKDSSLLNGITVKDMPEWYKKNKYLRKVINILKEIGVEIYSNTDRAKKEKLLSSAKEYFEKKLICSLGEIFPHMEAFRNINVQNKKIRLVVFKDENYICNEKYMKVTFNNYWKKENITKKEQSIDINWCESFDSVSENIIHALDIFAKTCGGEQHLIFAHLSKSYFEQKSIDSSCLKIVDLGIYDECCVVESHAAASAEIESDLSSNGLWRQVSFSYYSNINSMPYATLFKDCIKSDCVNGLDAFSYKIIKSSLAKVFNGNSNGK